MKYEVNIRPDANSVEMYIREFDTFNQAATCIRAFEEDDHYIEVSEGRWEYISPANVFSASIKRKKER